MNRIAVLVLGMHRSGTSVLTGVLNRLGCDVPKNLLPGMPSDNKTGFFEGRDIYDAHETFLHAIGLSWDSTDPIHLERLDKAAVEALNTQVSKILAENFRDSNIFAIKDPRICRLVPIWRTLLEQFGANVSVVIPYRYPADVAWSLQDRNQMPDEQALLLWLRHVLEAEADTRDLPRSFVNYPQLLHDWRTVVAIIEADLRLVMPRHEAEAEAAVDQLVTPEYCHFASPRSARTGIRNLLECCAVRVFLQLERLSVAPYDQVAQDSLDHIAAILSAADRLLDAPQTSSHNDSPRPARLVAAQLRLRHASSLLDKFAGKLGHFEEALGQCSKRQD